MVRLNENYIKAKEEIETLFKEISEKIYQMNKRMDQLEKDIARGFYK